MLSRRPPADQEPTATRVRSSAHRHERAFTIGCGAAQIGQICAHVGPLYCVPTAAQITADQERPEHLQQSQSVTRLATSGQFVMAANGQISMTVKKRRGAPTAGARGRNQRRWSIRRHREVPLASTAQPDKRRLTCLNPNVILTTHKSDVHPTPPRIRAVVQLPATRTSLQR
jgi:hypothetical protein